MRWTSLPSRARSGGIAPLLLGVGLALGSACVHPTVDRAQAPERLELVRPAAPAPERPVVTPRARVVEEAQRMLGAPYRYGGRTPAGFDCSGLVGYAYARAGRRDLPRSAAALYQRAEPVPLDGILPGDLLFFTFGSERIRHVAVYTGDRSFIHAPKSGGRVERISFDHPYWSRQLRLAGRLLAP